MRGTEPDGEQLLALEDFCRAVGLAGCWTSRGPTERGQLFVRRRHLATLDQEFAAALTFRLWRTEGPSPNADVVVELDPQTLDALRVLCDRWKGRPPRRRR